MTELDTFLAGLGLSRNYIITSWHHRIDERTRYSRDHGIEVDKQVAYRTPSGEQAVHDFLVMINNVEAWIAQRNDDELLGQWRDLRSFF